MSNFKILTDSEHVLARFSMYGGSQVLQQEDVFINAELKTLPLVGGLLKVINEIIDNSVDEYIRTKGTHANKISVKIQDGEITVSDNGRGFPAMKVDSPDGPEYQMQSAFTRARAGSNFDDSKREGAGTNGVGSFLTNVTSKEFEAWSCDGTSEVYLYCENGKTINVSHKQKKTNGTTVRFIPNYEFFGVSGLDENHILMIKERLKSLSVAYPKIKFSFNNEVMKSSFEDFFKSTPIKISDSVEYGIAKSNGSFMTASIVNGLTVKSGSHIDYFWNSISDVLLDKINKKYKLTITKARLKQHFKIFSNISGFVALKFDSQTKERVTNSTSEIKNKVGDIPVDKVVRTIMSDKDLIDEILAYTKLQENLEAKKDLDKLNKKKKIKSDKFFDSVGGTKRIFVCEGDSALGGMMSILGRKGNAFYALKGVPMNVMGISHQKFMSNKELSELYSIITSTDSEVIICSDADADGSHIVGLLILFFQTYFKNELNSGKIKRLVTPLIVGTKGDKVVEWSYDLKTEETKGVSYSYSKGLGSWDKDQLRFIIESEGFENMLQTANSVDDSILEDWFGTNSSARKDMIKSFPAFDISVV